MKSIKKKLLNLLVGSCTLFILSCEKEVLEETKPQTQQSQQAPQKEIEAANKIRIAQDNARLEVALKGGLEKPNGSSNLRAIAATIAPRVLVNGAILGHNKSNDVKPFLSSSNNLLVDVSSLLERLDYAVVPYDGYLIATRNANNTFGSKSIHIVLNSGQMYFYDRDGNNYRSVTLPETTKLQNGRYVAPARILARLAGASLDQWDAESLSLQLYYYEELDLGIYFYGKQYGISASDSIVGCQKYIQGEPNLFFDPSKPTLIYVHGWQPNKVNERYRESYELKFGSMIQNVQNYWIDKGWNVAIFNWIQIADDDWLMPIETEKKIYDAYNWPYGMRWKKSDGSFSAKPKPSLSVREMFSAEYLKIIQALAPNAEIRMLGASLGGNLTMAMLRDIAKYSFKTPARVTLGDPYWDGSLDHWWDGINLPDGLSNTKAFGEDAAKRLNTKGVAIEYIRNSLGGIPAYNRGIANIAAFTEFYPDYTSDLTQKHTLPPFQYLWSMGLPNILNGNSPQISNADVRKMMSTQSYWELSQGKTSVTPADDVYIIKVGKP